MLYNGVWEKSNKDQATESPRRPRKGAGSGERLNLGQVVGAEDRAAEPQAMWLNKAHLS